MKRLFVFTLLIYGLSACSEDEAGPTKKPTDPVVVPIAVNYTISEDQLSEQSETHSVVISLSKAAEGDGNLEITLSGDIETGFFTTEPAVSGGSIFLAVTKGDTEVSFDVLPINNTKLNGDKVVSFVLAKATGSVKLGEATEYMLTLVDDELVNKLQTYEKNGSAFNYNKNSYEYNEAGLISKVNWEAKTVFGANTGTTEYFYNEAGGITHISRFNGAQQTRYTWENGLIVKVEKVQEDVVLAYDTHEHDEAGRLQTVYLYTKNTAGELVSTNHISYSYFEDGNVHKIIQYAFDRDKDEYVVSMTTTYGGYVEGHNPDALEVVPNQKIQTKLPTYYSREVASGLQEYNAAYEFSENGNLIKKTVTGSVADSGVTTYSYY